MRAAALTVLAVLAVATPAVADGAADRAEAKRLFDSGRAAITAGKIEDACTMFEASFKLEPAIGTKLNLADCLERKGLLAAAYRLFDEAAVEAARSSKGAAARASRAPGPRRSRASWSGSTSPSSIRRRRGSR